MHFNKYQKFVKDNSFYIVAEANELGLDFQDVVDSNV